MAFDNRRTYLCYNNSDLIRDGYIRARIEKEYDPVDTFNIDRLRNPPKGVNYVVTRDASTGEITAVREVKKQLPASKIKIEIDFSKVMSNAVTHPFSPDALGFHPMVSFIATPLLASVGFGGITSGLTYMTLQLLDAETKFNRKITVTEEMIETGVWECEDGYPLSVFGIVKDHYIEPEVAGDVGSYTGGLEFDEDDPLKDSSVIGKYSDGVWQGSRRKRISGATDSSGLFGGAGDAEIKFDNVAYDDQPQLFDKIVRDDRTLKFRGDNYDATGGKDYPFKLNGVPGIDATDKQIRLKLTDDTTGESLFSEGDTLFITYSVASERHLRQNLNHRGDIGQGNTIGLGGFRGAVRSEVDAFDYQLMTWKVPLLPSGIEMENIDELEDFYKEDEDYKLSLSQYMEARSLEEEEEDASELHDTVEGWRLSESITNGHVKKFWAADYRGILFFDDGEVEIIYPEVDIRDQDWFRKYLEDLDFTSPTGGVDADGNDIYVTADLQKKIEDYIDLGEEPGYLFDLTDISNSLLFDREKFPYYRPFADALKNVSKYKEDDDESGIGIILLDMIAVAEGDSTVILEDVELSLYDLSYIEFYNANAQPVKSYSCDEPFDIHSYHYWSESYDANTDSGGAGAWYDRGHIDQEVFEWRPPGSSIESYWKLETPYFCGEYSRKSRVYTEKLSGNSLDNYSWIFVDTEPFVPHNISSDSHRHFDESIVVFNDDLVNYGLSYHKFLGYNFESREPNAMMDESRSHVKETYDYDRDFWVGQNRMLGDTPSFSNGIAIVDDVVRICNSDNAAWFWFTEPLYNGWTDYGLDFADDPPTANIPSDWYIKKLIVDFSMGGFDDLEDLEKYVGFYFEGSESSISEVRVLREETGDTGTARLVVDFKYYNNGPLQFLGEFWKKIEITNVEVRATSADHPINPLSIDLDDYKIKSGQNAAVYDGLGRLLVFHANTETSNIDVSISYDDGNEWIIHKSLIRLIEGESAGMPFVLKDKNADYVHLFYTLNDIFLMYKRINTDFFIFEDAFVDAKIPTSYDVDDYDQTLTPPDNDIMDWPEKVYWGEFTDRGNILRQYPSYFIAGDADEPFFKEQLRIRDDLIDDWESSPATDTRQYPRFEYSGDQTEMKDAFKGDGYSVYMDDEGVLRLFLLSDGKLSVKRSNNYFSWKYDIEEQIIHKTYIDDELNKGIPEEIRNVQIVRNGFTGGMASTLYFHNGMLFIRHFHSDLLFPFYDSNGDMNNDNMREHLEITEATTHRPIFLVGKIPEAIREKRIEEIDAGIDYMNSELFIYFPYGKEMLERFDERFEIDVDTQVYAYTTKTGLIRVFYKDSFGNLNGLVLDALKIPVLEVMNKFKDS